MVLLVTPRGPLSFKTWGGGPKVSIGLPTPQTIATLHVPSIPHPCYLIGRRHLHVQTSGAMWKNLSEAEKEEYKKRAEQLFAEKKRKEREAKREERRRKRKEGQGEGQAWGGN